MKTCHVVASLLLIWITPLRADAADVGFYVGIEGGQSHSELGPSDDRLILHRGTLLDSSSDRRDETFGLYGGYSFAKHFAIEFAYADLSQASYTAVRDLPGFPGFPVSPAGIERQQTTSESESLSLSLAGRYEFAANLFLTGRAGVAIHRIESDIRVWLNDQPITVIGGNDDGSTGMGVLGPGVEWGFHPRWNVRLQVQRHFALEDEQINLVERGDITLFTGGVGYRF
jgi:Outer membrane protein beta-barrel domain